MVSEDSTSRVMVLPVLSRVHRKIRTSQSLDENLHVCYVLRTLVEAFDIELLLREILWGGTKRRSDGVL